MENQQPKSQNSILQQAKLDLILSKAQIEVIASGITEDILNFHRNGIDKFVIGGDYSQLLITHIRHPFYGSKKAPQVLYLAGNLPTHFGNEAKLFNLTQTMISKYLH